MNDSEVKFDETCTDVERRMFMNKTKGRPRKDDKKNRKVVVRLSNSDYRKLDYMHHMNGKNSSEIMRDALDLYYEMHKFK